jgi:hypothetical protein
MTNLPTWSLETILQQMPKKPPECAVGLPPPIHEDWNRGYYDYEYLLNNIFDKDQLYLDAGMHGMSELWLQIHSPHPISDIKLVTQPTLVGGFDVHSWVVKNGQILDYTDTELLKTMQLPIILSKWSRVKIVYKAFAKSWKKQLFHFFCQFWKKKRAEIRKKHRNNFLKQWNKFINTPGCCQLRALTIWKTEFIKNKALPVSQRNKISIVFGSLGFSNGEQEHFEFG